MEPHSLYLHIPFCTHRCSYCDFNTYAGIESLIPEYTHALCREIELASLSAQERWGSKMPVHTIFFGGGTPSLLPAEELEKIFSAFYSYFDILPDVEITLEANPGSLSLPYLKDLTKLGVNRISLGMQSAHPEQLRLLERMHDLKDVVQSVEWARTAGIRNLNLDLIFGLPYQELDTWKHTLEMALSLGPAHFSLYALTLEHGTPMQHWVNRGLLNEPDPDLAADMYELATGKLKECGYEQYEISNWSRREKDGVSFACKHNLQYWRNQPYLGLGAGAHGFTGGYRTVNVLSPANYVQRCLHSKEQAYPRTPATASCQEVDRSNEIQDTMIMGLRLVREGISRKGFEQRFGECLEELFGPEIDRLVRSGLLEWGKDVGGGECLRLTQGGRLLGNMVFMEFVGV